MSCKQPYCRTGSSPNCIEHQKQCIAAMVHSLFLGTKVSRGFFFIIQNQIKIETEREGGRENWPTCKNASRTFAQTDAVALHEPRHSHVVAAFLAHLNGPEVGAVVLTIRPTGPTTTDSRAIAQLLPQGIVLCRSVFSLMCCIDSTRKRLRGMILLNISKRPCSTCNVCATPSQAFALTGILRFLLLRIATNLSGREGEENVSGRVGLGWGD